MSTQSDFVYMWKKTEEFANELGLKIILGHCFELEGKCGESVQEFETVKELRAYLMGREDGIESCEPIEIPVTGASNPR